MPARWASRGAATAPRATCRVCLALALIAIPATGTAQGPFKVPGGMRIVERRSVLIVTDGTHAAPLPVCGSTISSLDRVTVARDRVTIVYGGACCAAPDLTLSLRALRARLENVAALQAHRGRDHAAAALGFARAAALDPDLEVARLNLAAAYALGGRRASAVDALAPLIARNPVRVYQQVLSDPELAALLEAPEVKALCAAKPGSAALRETDLRRAFVAHSPDRDWIAALDLHTSWGASSWEAKLVLLEGASGRELSTLLLARFVDVDPDSGKITGKGRRSVDAQLAIANRLLRDLGFVRPDELEFGRVEGGSGGTITARFARARLGLVVKQSLARIVRGNEVLVTRKGLASIFGVGWAAFASKAGLVVFSWAVDEPEGCMLEAPTGITVLHLPQR